MGIDGKIYPVGTKPSDQNSMFAGDWYPVQVKQTERVGRPLIDQFEAVMTREERQRGFVVAFGFSADAVAESRAFLLMIPTPRCTLDTLFGAPAPSPAASGASRPRMDDF